MPDWVPWFQIHPETVFDHTTQHVTAWARTSDHIDLFVIGFDNVVWSTYWQAPPHDGSWLDAIGDFFEGAWNVLTTAVGGVIDTLDGVFGGILDALAGVIGLVCSIPYIGTPICTAWNLILELVWIPVSSLDFLLGLLGILPEKRLRLCIIVQLDEKGEPVASNNEVLDYLQRAIDVFKQRANVRIIPVGPFNYTSAFQDPPRASLDYVHVDTGVSGPDTLNLPCGFDGWVQLTEGASTLFTVKLIQHCFWGNWRRLLGYGAPVTAFAVGPFTTPDDGCTLWPFTDYVFVNFRNQSPRPLPHELGHACNLWHYDDPCNLMTRGDQGGIGDLLTRFQVAWLRASRHVTYF